MAMFAIPNPFKPTTIRQAQAVFERATNSEARWERKYWTDNEWVDIQENFSYDVSKEGNEFVRAIRWDGGFRSYRVDRGLEIREKKQEEGPAESLLSSFGKSFATSALTTLALKGLTLVPGPVGVVARGLSAVAGTRVFSMGSLIATGFNIANALVDGESAGNIAASALGGLAGGFLGSNFAKGVKIFPTQKAGYPFQLVSAQYQKMGPFAATEQIFKTKTGTLTESQAFFALGKANRAAFGSASKIIKIVKKEGTETIVSSASKQGPALQEALGKLAGKLRTKPGMFGI